MGQQTNRRLIYITVSLVVAALVVHFNPSVATSKKEKSLSQAFFNIEEWRMVGEDDLSQEVLLSLDLDDYLFRDYSNSRGIVSLYIGYYRDAEKIGAAHSPLVCFPGQG